MTTTTPTRRPAAGSDDGIDTANALSTPAVINLALDRVRAEQQRANRVLVAAAKCRRLSALYEHEARLWTLLSRHTAEHVYRRAAVEAQCAARGRAREYAELALTWPADGGAR